MSAAKVVVEMTPEQYEAFKAGNAMPKKSSGRPRKAATNKVCPEGKVLNSRTGRCRKSRAKYTKKASSPISPKQKKCPPGQVVNPETNRCKRTLQQIIEDTLKRSEELRARRARNEEARARGEMRPLTDYQQHMKEKIAELKEIEARTGVPLTAKERFRVAVQAWRERSQ